MVVARSMVLFEGEIYGSLSSESPSSVYYVALTDLTDATELLYFLIILADYLRPSLLVRSAIKSMHYVMLACYKS